MNDFGAFYILVTTLQINISPLHYLVYLKRQSSSIDSFIQKLEEVLTDGIIPYNASQDRDEIIDFLCKHIKNKKDYQRIILKFLIFSRNKKDAGEFLAKSVGEKVDFFISDHEKTRFVIEIITNEDFTEIKGKKKANFYYFLWFFLIFLSFFSISRPYEWMHLVLPEQS